MMNSLAAAIMSPSMEVEQKQCQITPALYTAKSNCIGTDMSTPACLLDCLQGNIYIYKFLIFIILDGSAEKGHLWWSGIHVPRGPEWE